MSPEALEALLEGAEETDAVEFKEAVAWDRKLFVKDILAMANVVDGGSIIVGVEDNTFARQGMTDELIATYNSDIMKDQVAPFADPRVAFRREIVTDARGLRYVVIEVAPFEETPVICRKGGHDVKEGDLYFRSRVRRPQSARVSRSEDMREIVEAAIARRLRNLRRIGLAPEPANETAIEPDAMAAFDDELGGL